MTRARDVANLIGSGNYSSTTFTATAGQTAFSISHTQGFVQVFMNGLLLDETVDYTSNGSAITLTSGAAAGDEIEVVKYNTFSVGDAIPASGGTFTGAVTHSGTVTNSGNVTFAAGADIITATAGTDNVRLGENAGDSIASGGNQNTLIGKDAGTSITTGVENVFVGYAAGDAVTDADYNIGVGWGALGANVLGSKSVAVGTGALDSQNPASATDMHNTAVGHGAGGAVTTATRNTVVGSSAGSSNQTSLYNTYVGYGAGQSTTGQGNTFIGDASGNSVAAGEFNTLLGQQAGNAITSGDKNTVIGRYMGNQDNLDSRTKTNSIVISNGDGKPALHFDNDQGYFGTWTAGNYQSNSYWPISGSTSGHNAITQNLSAGQLGVSTDSSSAIFLNRNNADGVLIYFYSEGTLEGNISVSGSTVSYNGGHLARYSQLSDGSKDASILKGTVMTNLDKMCVWEVAAVAEGDTIKSASGDERTATKDDVADAYTEDNEQLNCMAVSSVEGDPNVAGVFVNWDTADDGYNDMNIAMTGDMVIRIAKGVTVARGDLLMSAGDGTAKPQDDDIVRSKTIAKVTSTNVSHTYDDGSFLVPCVLMAC